MTNNEIVKEIEESIRLINQTKTTVNDALCHARNVVQKDDKAIEEAYNKGWEDAWEWARKIVLPITEGGFSTDEVKEIFSNMYPKEVMTNLTAQEALAKLEAYKKEKGIKVGDVVTGYNGGEEYVVLATEDEMPSGHPLLRNKSNGKVCFATTCSLIKTGEHIDILSLFT